MKAIILGLLLCITSVAMADGKYFAATATDPPNMPRQQALITFRDGIETLIVESVVESEGEELAWIVPVPSEPIEVTFASPGTVATLPAVLAPKVVTGAALMPEVFVPLALILLLYGLTALRKSTMTATRFLVGGVALVTLWFVFAAIMFPVFASAGLGDVAGGDWRQTDGWESTAVSGTQPSDIVGWLKENGFSVPQEAETVIASYVEDGWWFAVARVSGEEGEGAPRPLKIVFKTDKPIYPMRLTGVGLDSIYLDLCVIADKPAKVDSLRTWDSRPWNSQEPPTKHPRLAELAWDGAVATRMVGEVSGDALDQDVVISLDGKLGKRTVASEGAIAIYGITWTAVAMCAALLLVGTLCIARKWPLQKLMLFGFLLPIVLGVLATIAVSRIVPTVETSRYGHLAAQSDAEAMNASAEQWADDIGYEETYKENAARYVRDIDSKWGKDVPGGVVREQDQIVAYDEHGNPTYFEITDAEDDDTTDD